MINKKALILINIGTPKSAHVEDVRKYLAEFLMDPYILRMPTFFRWIFVNGIITRVRPSRSAKKYQSIWTAQGSPLLVESNQFKDELQKLMPQHEVVVAMRYSEPSILSVLKSLKEKNIQDVVIAPMYPQEAESTTTSSLVHIKNMMKKIEYYPRHKVLKPFYNEESFVQAWSLVYRKHTLKMDVDHVLFSYHGLPERHLVLKNKTCLLNSNCCLEKSACEKGCYKAQCLKTTALIAKELNFKPNFWTTSFQSRVGVTKWTTPSTVESVVKLARQGVKNLAVLCPSFVVDGLETLEEINLEIREEFLKHGGQNFIFVPCPNSEPDWVQGFERLVSKDIKALDSST
jgi:ferrochelatase